MTQAVATKVRLRRENSVLRYALRQSKNVAAPPLANYKFRQLNSQKPMIQASTYFSIKELQIHDSFLQASVRQEPWYEQ